MTAQTEEEHLAALLKQHKIDHEEPPYDNDDEDESMSEGDDDGDDEDDDEQDDDKDANDMELRQLTQHIQKRQQLMEDQQQQGACIRWMIEGQKSIARDAGINLRPLPANDSDDDDDVELPQLQQQQQKQLVQRLIQQQHELMRQLQQFIQQQGRQVALIRWLVESQQWIARDAGDDLPPPPGDDDDVELLQQKLTQQLKQLLMHQQQQQLTQQLVHQQEQFIHQQRQFISQQQQRQGALFGWIIESKQRVVRHVVLKPFRVLQPIKHHPSI